MFQVGDWVTSNVPYAPSDVFRVERVESKTVFYKKRAYRYYGKYDGLPVGYDEDQLENAMGGYPLDILNKKR